MQRHCIRIATTDVAQCEVDDDVCILAVGATRDR
jgi:hypothetical protein